MENGSKNKMTCKMKQSKISDLTHFFTRSLGFDVMFLRNSGATFHLLTVQHCMTDIFSFLPKYPGFLPTMDSTDCLIGTTLVAFSLRPNTKSNTRVEKLLGLPLSDTSWLALVSALVGI